MSRRFWAYPATFLVLTVAACAFATPVSFTLLTHADNTTWLPQPTGEFGVSGDHLLHTSDDETGGTFNPDGCFSFNFMNPVGELEPDYPPGYAEGIHSMTGGLVLDLDLAAGGALSVSQLEFDGYVAPAKTVARQRLVNPGDPAADGNHGPVDGQPNSGSYAASPVLNWAFEVMIDWYYDTPFGGPGTIDMTFNDYAWSGFIIPVNRLNTAGMSVPTLDDPLGYFPGTSEDFETWLLSQVAPRLPAEATYLLFAQGEAHPEWTHPMMGMTTDGIIGGTIIAYTTAPEPASFLILALGLGGSAGLRRARKTA